MTVGRAIHILASGGAMIGAFLLAGSLAGAATAKGTVFNRTTGKPAAGVELSLLNMMAGAAQVGTTKSDASGQFSFENDGIGRGPMLIRASFGGVTFNTALPPGRPNVDVDVFEVSKDPKMIAVVSHIVVFQPRGDTLLVGEEYGVENNSQPARAYFRGEGNFEFALPPDAKLQNISTTSSTGMPVTQAAIDRGKGRNAIAYTFRPGETNVRLSYELPYAGNAAELKLPVSYPDMKMLVVAPPGITVRAEGLSAAAPEQGMMVYSHAPLAMKQAFAVGISGIAAAVPQEPEGGADSSGGGSAAGTGMPNAQEGNSRLQSENIQAVPGRLDVLKWPILGGFALLFALGAMVLSRRTVVAAPMPGGESSLGAETVGVATSSAAASVAAVKAEVASSLDALKDALFRLELRKQAGTISEADYKKEKAEMDRRLRELVRGDG